MELTPFDYQILDFISKREPVTKAEILKHFSSQIDTIEYRLDNLSKPIYTVPGRPPLSNYVIEEMDRQPDGAGGYITTRKGIYILSSLGKKTLQDYKLEVQIAKHRKREEIFWRAVPIVISLFALAKSYQWL
ncbi:MAG: hypothetical protein ABFC57_12670 [Veillonellales bacterium]